MSGQVLVLMLTPPATGPGSLPEQALVRFDPADHTLAVTASSGCVHYPDDTPVDQEGKPADLPTGTAPAPPPGR
ncbi:hypothetical protein ACIQOV_25710 [Kitasatospora sp. NPDC091257]|uniref:hypothetical protein n=1 Tax=Kitasatospora sp. NPDC091257 TaxID=3364084 RepID=UPI0038169F53